MPRNHGKNTRVYVDGWDFSGITNAVELTPGARPMAVATCFADPAETVLPGKLKATAKLGGFFDIGVAVGAGGFDEQMWTDLTANTGSVVGAYPSGSGQSSWGYELGSAFLAKTPRKAETTTAVMLDAEWEQSGSAARVNVLANGPVTAVGVVAGSVAQVGGTLATDTCVGVARLLAVGGSGSLTVAIEHSGDNGVADAYVAVSGMSATLTGASQVAFLSYAGTTKQWKRVNVTAFSGFSSATLFVVVGSYPSADKYGNLPLLIPGLVLWGEATAIQGLSDGQAIASVVNLANTLGTSGQVTGVNQPLYQVISSTPVIRTGSLPNRWLDLLSLPTVSSPGLTMFFVLSNGNLTNNAQEVYLRLNRTNAGSEMVRLLQAFNQVIAVTNGGTQLWMPGLGVLAGPTVMCLRVNADGTIDFFRDNQRSYRKQSNNGVAVDARTSVDGFLGTYDGTQNFLTGDTRSYAVYAAALSDASTLALMGYWRAKHGLASANNDRIVVFDGDSLTVGYPAAPGHTDQLLTGLSGQFRAFNVGTINDTIVNMLATAAAKVDARLDLTVAKNICVIWAGTNDLANSPGSSTTVYNNIVSYCQARRSAGWKVVVCTLLPRGATAQFETDRTTVNTNIRNNWNTFADALADIGADATIGVANAQNNTTYYQADKTHLTTAGYGISAGIVRTAVAGL